MRKIKPLIKFSDIPGCTLSSLLGIFGLCILYMFMTMGGPNYTVDGKEHKYYEKPFTCFALAAFWEKQEPAADWFNWLLNLIVVLLYGLIIYWLIVNFVKCCNRSVKHVGEKLRAENKISILGEHRKKRIFLDI